MLYRMLSRLTVIGGCSLLFAGTMVSCDPSSSDDQEMIQVDVKPLIVPQDTAFYKIAYKVFHANTTNQIVFQTKQYRYSVWSTDPHDQVPTFSAWRCPLDSPKQKVRETWSVDIKTGKVNYFLTPSGEELSEGYYSNNAGILQEKMGAGKAQQLQKYFDDAQAECVKEILKRY